MNSQDDPAQDAPQAEDPQVFSVNQDDQEVQFSRRSFLEVAAAASAAAVVLTGCDQIHITIGSTETPGPTNPPPPTATSPATATSASTATNTPTQTPTLTPTVPTKTFTPTPVPLATVSVDIAYVYPGSDMSFRADGSVNKGETVLVLGRDPSRKWVYVEYNKTKRGWMMLTTLNFPGELQGLIELTPMPTPTRPPTSVPPPGSSGSVPAGQTGINYTYVDSSGKTVTWNAPCGSPLPAGAVCVCNCITVPSCSCVGNTCSCVGNTCTCDTVHYWYPN